MSDTAIRIEHLKKRYRLGQIGGTTLKAEIQSWWAKTRHREDPNLKLDMDQSRVGEAFYALDDISLEIRQGEAVGIIGANGAGKSTLLKILSRVTAPTEGDIYINGRISSMLEVGTGFHAELTGRENIYMNGAILGMTKKEIDSKIESIIDFSECRQFIDTPVKRYSSGMYVKLAFAVASHLDSEILIMDEVLAVGDMAFQKKSLTKMGDAAENEGRTVLYVPHNMATIRNLCTRCIVLNKGKLVYDGDVENAISLYLNNTKSESLLEYDFSDAEIHRTKPNGCFIRKISLKDKAVPRYTGREPVVMRVEWEAEKELGDVRFGLSLKNVDGSPVGYAESRDFLKKREAGNHVTEVAFDVSNIAEGSYFIWLELFYMDGANGIHSLDEVGDIYFEVLNVEEDEVRWERLYWGSVRLNRLLIQKET